MHKILYNKRGEMTTTQIVSLIVLIFTVAVITILLVRMNLKGTTDTQLCHNSVVQRGSGVPGISSTPLNCKTHYLCISANSKCSDSRMPNPDKIVQVKNEVDIYNALAEEMANCWWIYGEGKVDYIGGAPGILPNLYCSVCSNVIFDNSITQKISSLDKGGLNLYLDSTLMPNSEKTYADYFYRGGALADAQLFPEKLSFAPVMLDLKNSFYIVTARTSKAAGKETALFGLIGYTYAYFFGKDEKLVLLPVLVSQENFNKIPCDDVNTLS